MDLVAAFLSLEFFDKRREKKFRDNTALTRVLRLLFFAPPDDLFSETNVGDLQFYATKSPLLRVNKSGQQRQAFFISPLW
jgi:hypothetical protein